MKSAKEFWKEKFDEYPRTDADKLAVAMMAEYSQEIKKEVWNLSAKEVLSGISETFLNKENQSKAMLNADKVVFQAIGETIKNFPIADCPL